jgi:hypothetical protein
MAGRECAAGLQHLLGRAKAGLRQEGRCKKLNTVFVFVLAEFHASPELYILPTANRSPQRLPAAKRGAGQQAGAHFTACPPTQRLQNEIGVARAATHLPAKCLVSVLTVMAVTPPCRELTTVKKQQEGRSLGLTAARADRSSCAAASTLSLAGRMGSCGISKHPVSMHIPSAVSTPCHGCV